jgi:hypothetical protein
VSALGDIALRALDLSWLDGRQRSTLRHMADCKTERLGGNVLSCECGNREVHWNSCRDRHCPLCQGAARARWVSARLGELLPCPYFHVVFTVPHELVPLALANRHLFYRTLFLSVHQTLLAVSANPANLDARIGGMSVLHTWNQKLAFHPHLHCIIPGGGIAVDGASWITGNRAWFVSVKRLSLVFRGKLLSSLGSSLDKDELQGDKAAHHIALRKAAAKAFVVYAKSPFGGPAQVVKYLGRYTHRVGISEQRIISADERHVCFSWTDRAAGHSRKLLHLSIEEFVRKFMLHILPRGFRKIRYFGFMANRDRTASLERVRGLITSSLPIQALQKGPTQPTGMAVENPDHPEPETGSICSKCGLPLRLQRQVMRASTTGSQESRPIVLHETHGPEPNLRIFA